MQNKNIFSVLFALVFILIIAVTVVYTRAADTQDAVTSATITNTGPVVDEVRISSTQYGTNSFASGIPTSVGADTNIHITGVVSDANGEADIASTSVIFYRTAKGSACTPDKNDCYTLSGCTLDATYGSATEVQFDCALDLAYWVDATADASRYAGDDWTALVAVSDLTPIAASLTKTVEVNSLLALNIPEAINYGNRVLGEQTTVATNQETVLTQRGNTKADVEVQGTAMSCAGVGTIPVGAQRWSLIDEDYASSTNILSIAKVRTFRNVGYRESESTELSSSLFWNIGIPTNGVQGSCTGANTISILAVPVDEATLFDSKLANVAYTSAHQVGLTDADGKFFYTPGDTVSFSIGSCSLGSIANINADSKVFITEIAGLARSATTDSKSIKLARFLQSLDTDEDNTNGIAIASSVHTSLASSCGDIQTIDDTTLASRVASAYSGRALKSASAARTHLEDTLIAETGAVFQDTTPTAFSFTNQTGVIQNGTITSNAVTLTGFDGTLTATCTGCIAIGKNGGFTNGTSLSGFAPNDTIQLRLTSSASLNTMVTASVVLGGTTSGTWSVTTTNQDTTPDAFSFNDKGGVVPNNTITSNAVTLTGFTGTLTATCTGCTAIGKNGVFTNGTSLSGFAPNDTIQLRLTSSASLNTMITASVVLGGTTSGTWLVPTVASIDVVIGTQTWMKYNMNVGTMLASGSIYPSSSAIEKWCYNNDEIICEEYGALYSWAEAQDVCPSGYHIPSDDEFKTLEIFLGMSSTTANLTGFRGTDQGTKLRTDWTVGFLAPLSGHLNILNDHAFNGLGNAGHMWTSSISSTNAWGRELGGGIGQVGRVTRSQDMGQSVRCLKN